MRESPRAQSRRFEPEWVSALDFSFVTACPLRMEYQQFLGSTCCPTWHLERMRRQVLQVDKNVPE
jgi:hypothetical protein